MIELIGILERGWDRKMETRWWRQIAGAYGALLILVHRDFDTMEEALAAASYPLIFVVPPGRAKSVEVGKLPSYPKASYVFGCPGENLVRFMSEDSVSVHLTTPKPCDMMATSVAGTILYERR